MTNEYAREEERIRDRDLKERKGEGKLGGEGTSVPLLGARRVCYSASC